jgi:integrase
VNWIDGLDGPLRKRLEILELIERREGSHCPTVREWVDQYIKGRVELKPRSIMGLRTIEAHVVRIMGDRVLDQVTPAHAESFRATLLAEGKAQATVANAVKKTKQFFLGAVKARIIATNPFNDVKQGSMDNPERMVYVSSECIHTVIDACPTAQWRLLFALARFAGLRIPSDIVNLKIEDIHWDKGFFWIQAEKTRHHNNKGLRRVPITPELQPPLLDATEQLDEGEVHLLPDLRNRSNLRTQAKRIIKRSGVAPWVKTFQNLRVSRETEWMDDFGLRRACNWMGNTPAVAMKHYSILRDEDFLEAAHLPPPSAHAGGDEGGHEGGDSQCMPALAYR